MLRLLSLLQTGRRWAAAELATALDCEPRTLRRDIGYLRELGYPVLSARGPGGHYQLVAGRAMPPLMLEDDEAIATVVALKLASAGNDGPGSATESAQRAAAKLRRILPARLRRTTDELLDGIEVAAAGEPAPAPALLGVVTAAISGSRGLTFGYSGAAGRSERRVEPVRLLRMRQRWYLFAWDLDRADWRTFRLDRIVGVPRPGERHAPRALPSADVAGYLHDRFFGAAEHTVVLQLHASAEDAAIRLYRVDGVLEPLSDDRCRYTAQVDSFEWLALVLLLTDVAFTVEDSEPFRAYLAAQAARLLRGAGE